MMKHLSFVTAIAMAGCLAPVDQSTTPSLLATPAWSALLIGDSVRLTAPISTPRWTSDNPNVATVSADGLVRAQTLGRATIIASRSERGDTAVATIVVAPPVFVGAGDIGVCGGTLDDEATAEMLDTTAGVVFTAGDNAYVDGTEEEFDDCYESTWGRHKHRTRPTPGNHDYNTPGATAYYSYFGSVAGDSGVGYYSFDFAGWHIISLNSNVAMSAGGAEEQWLRNDLASSSALCTLAYWHHPRFSSGLHGSDPVSEPLWQALYDGHADVIIVGHDHTYERFAPQTPGGAPDPTSGIREFVAGTGGAGLYPFPTIAPNSEFRNNITHGVLKLTLAQDGYAWEFISTQGASVDAGTASCR
jgi:hypothetical protein